MLKALSGGDFYKNLFFKVLCSFVRGKFSALKLQNEAILSLARLLEIIRGIITVTLRSKYFLFGARYLGGFLHIKE